VIVSQIPPQTDIHDTEAKVDNFETLGASVDEKSQPPSSPMDAVRTRFSLPRLTISLFLRRLKRAVLSISISLSISVETRRTARSSTAPMLRRMARTRRLVTSLARLLATKSDVIAQIRKRLLTTGQSGLGNGAGKDGDIEVVIHMGDVQGESFYTCVHTSVLTIVFTDHILTLQHALAHYERMLSQSHPTYLSQLRMTAADAMSHQDKAVMLLTIVSIGVICDQIMIGMLAFFIHGVMRHSLMDIACRSGVYEYHRPN
jgi:magnesium transporter